jgi:hypothetical protein
VCAAAGLMLGGGGMSRRAGGRWGRGELVERRLALGTLGSREPGGELGRSALEQRSLAAGGSVAWQAGRGRAGDLVAGGRLRARGAWAGAWQRMSWDVGEQRVRGRSERRAGGLVASRSVRQAGASRGQAER